MHDLSLFFRRKIGPGFGRSRSTAKFKVFITKCFVSLRLAAKIDLDELNTKVKRLDTNISKIENELSNPEKHGELFNSMMQKFVENSASKVGQQNQKP